MDVIIEQIEQNNIAENCKLPSERELCEKYNISRATVRKAIDELEKEEYIYKKQGKGTFRAPKKVNQGLFKFYSFTEEMKKLGKIPSSKIINFEITKCDDSISKKMNINIGEQIYKFTRLRLADDKPMIYEVSYVPYERFPGIIKSDLEKNAMYDIFKNKFNANFTMAKQSFSSVVTREYEAKFLQISKNIPSMMIKRLTYEGQKIIEYTISIARGDMFKYYVVLKK